MLIIFGKCRIYVVALRDQIDVAKTLIWLSLSIGVGGKGASKQKLMLLRACDFEVTLGSADTLSFPFLYLIF